MAHPRSTRVRKSYWVLNNFGAHELEQRPELEQLTTKDLHCLELETRIHSELDRAEEIPFQVELDELNRRELELFNTHKIPMMMESVNRVNKMLDEYLRWDEAWIDTIEDWEF